jgi:hypothetical protein
MRGSWWTVSLEHVRRIVSTASHGNNTRLGTNTVWPICAWTACHAPLISVMNGNHFSLAAPKVTIRIGVSRRFVTAPDASR